MSEFRPYTTGILGGLNENGNPHSLADDDLSLALNTGRFEDEVGTRPGTTRPAAGEDFASWVDEQNVVQGIFEFRKNFDTDRRLLVITEHAADAGAGKCAVSYEDDARVNIDGGHPLMTAGQNYVWTAAMYQNKMFFAGGDTLDDFCVWDGNVANSLDIVALVDSGANRLRPQYVKAWRNFIFINGLRGQELAENNPAASRFCDFGTDATVVANWKDENTLGYEAATPGVDSFGKTYTTGFGQYQDNNGDWLLVLLNNGIQSYQLSSAGALTFSDAIPNGCVSQRAFVDLGLDSGDAIYMSERGIHSLRQSQEHGYKADEFISEKIRPTFATLNRTRYKYAIGAYNDVDGYVVFAVSTGSNNTHDLLIVLDVKDQERITAKNAKWYLWRLQGGLVINAMTFARASDDSRRLYFGTTNGDVGYFNAEVFSDFDTAGGAAAAYEVEWQTKHRDLGTTLMNKTLGDVMVTLAPGGAYTPTLKFVFDYGAKVSAGRSLTMARSPGGIVDEAIVGTSTVGARHVYSDELVYGSGEGRTIAFRFTHSTANQPFRVSKVDFEVAGGGEATGNV
jgi:hypothetical protein